MYALINGWGRLAQTTKDNSVSCSKFAAAARCSFFWQMACGGYEAISFFTIFTSSSGRGRFWQVKAPFALCMPKLLGRLIQRAKLAVQQQQQHRAHSRWCGLMYPSWCQYQYKGMTRNFLHLERLSMMHYSQAHSMPSNMDVCMYIYFLHSLHTPYGSVVRMFMNAPTQWP